MSGRVAPRARTALRWTGWRWGGWLAALGAATVVFRSLRGTGDDAHVAIVYLLIVLGASASGGRALGGALAALGFGLIDYYFQAPYDTLAVSKGHDWVVLFAFITTAAVATTLLARAQGEAAEARRRTEEARALARLGAETLRHADPDAALDALTGLLRRTLGAPWCVVRPWSAEQGLAARGRPEGATVDGATGPGATLDDATLGAGAERGRLLGVLADGTRAAAGDAAGDPAALEDDVAALGGRAVGLVVPLRIEGRVVGVLGVAGPRPLALDAARARALTALAHIAAVALDRRRLAREAAHALDLREANRLKDRVLASVSHDLRTPLTTIKALAQSAALAGDATGAAIEEQADRLAALVTDVLDLSRLRAGALPLQLEVNAAEDLVGAAARQVRGLLGGRRLAVAVDQGTAAGAPVLAGTFDFVHALRVLANLVGNALRVTPADGTVELAARREGAWLAFAVADRGPGVAAEERASIFEPFYRPPDAPADAGRAGLGLAIARELAAAQGGTLEYAPRAGGGSVFTLRLPAADAMEDGIDDAASVDESLTDGSLTGRTAVTPAAPLALSDP